MTNTPAIVEGKLLTFDDVAAILGLHPDHVRRLATRGEIPRVVFGRSVRFRPVDIQTFVDSHVVGVSPPPSRSKTGLNEWGRRERSAA